jgi:hypothetical protein
MRTHVVGQGSQLNPGGVFVVERPGLQPFLRELASFAEVVIFTAGERLASGRGSGGRGSRGWRSAKALSTGLSTGLLRATPAAAALGAPSLP